MTAWLLLLAVFCGLTWRELRRRPRSMWWYVAVYAPIVALVIGVILVR